MTRLNQISSISVLVYILVNLLVTIGEAFQISEHLNIYLSARLVALLLSLPCYFLFKKNAADPLPQLLFAISLLIYNLAGYYFIPLYIPSFIHSVYALAFFVFMSRRLFITTVSSMTFIFVLFCTFSRPYLPYDPGDMSTFDLIGVASVTLIIAMLIHHFYTAQRHTAEIAHIKFGTLGRLSARALHDVKGSLQNPLLLTNEIQNAADAKDYEQVKSIAVALESQFKALRGYLISYNQISKFIDLSRTNFNITESLNEALHILDTRLSKVAVHVHGDATLFGSQNLFCSIFINLINNSLDHFEISDTKNRNVFINISKNKIIYKDSTNILDLKLARQISNQYFTTKSEGSGLGIYFIKEALEQFNGQLNITHENDQLIFTVHFNRKFYFFKVRLTVYSDKFDLGNRFLRRFMNNLFTKFKS